MNVIYIYDMIILLLAKTVLEAAYIYILYIQLCFFKVYKLIMWMYCICIGWITIYL